MRISGRLGVAVAAAVMALVGALVPNAGGATSAPNATARVLGLGKLQTPSQVVTDAHHVWLIDGGRSVLEIDRATDAFVATYSLGALGLPNSDLGSILDDGSHVWIQSTLGPIAELSAVTGTRVAVRNPHVPSDPLARPLAMAVDVTYYWVLDGKSWLREFSKSTGLQVRKLSVLGGKAAPGDKVVSNGTNVFLLGTSLQTINVATGQEKAGPLLKPVGMRDPAAISLDPRGNLWVVSRTGTGTQVNGSFEQFDGDTGAPIMGGTQPGLAQATAIVPTPSGVWVLEGTNAREFDTIGDTLATITPPAHVTYTAVADDGLNLWITSRSSNELIELSDDRGTPEDVIYSSPEDVSYPSAIATDKNDVWVSEAGANAVTEFSAVTGAFVRVIQGLDYQFSVPGPLASNGTDVFVSSYVSSGNSLITEFDASSGAFVKTMVVSGPVENVAVDDSGDLWIQRPTSVADYDASDGILITTVPVTSSACNFASNGSSIFVKDTPSSELMAIDMATGTTEWSTSVDDAAGQWCGVATSGSKVFASDNWSVQKLSASTGEALGLDSLNTSQIHLDGLAADTHNIWVVVNGVLTGAYVLGRVDRTTNAVFTATPILNPTAQLDTTLIETSDGSNLWLIDGTQLSVTGPNATFVNGPRS